MNVMRRLSLTLASALGYLSTVQTAAAQTPAVTGVPVQLLSPQPSIKLVAPQQLKFFTSLQQVISNAIIIVFIVAALAVFVMLIWGGISWIVSGGDKDKVADARKKIVNALVGLAILALSYLILSVVGQIIGFNPLQGFSIPAPQ